MLSAADLSVIAMFWLTVSDMGFVVSDLDLTEPGYIKHVGPHSVYTFAILLRDDVEFPWDEFCRRLDAYSALSNVKPHGYGIEDYAARACTAYDPALGTYATEPLKNFHTVYISVFT